MAFLPCENHVESLYSTLHPCCLSFTLNVPVSFTCSCTRREDHSIVDTRMTGFLFDPVVRVLETTRSIVLAIVLDHSRSVLNMRMCAAMGASSCTFTTLDFTCTLVFPFTSCSVLSTGPALAHSVRCNYTEHCYQFLSDKKRVGCAV